MGHLEGNFTPVLYIGRKVPKGYYSSISVTRQTLQNYQHYRYQAKRVKESTVNLPTINGWAYGSCIFEITHTRCVLNC